MIKKTFPLVLLLTVVLLWLPAAAQNGLNAPYSQYGIGSSNAPYSSPWAAALGGVTYTQRSNTFINPYNPASYAGVEMQTFLFDMGLGVEMSTMKDPNASLYDADGNLAYISGAFAITKWWKTAVSIMPYSTVNYQSMQASVDPLWDSMNTTYEGYGSVTRILWGHGFNVTKNLSLGFNVNLLTGTVTRAITYDFVDNDSSAFMDSRKQKDTRVRNVTLDFGAQYRQPLGNDYALTLGLTLKTPQTMTVKDNALVYTYVTHSATEYMRDTIFPASGESGEYSSTLQQPFTLGLGLALERNERWQVAADFTYAPWSGMKYTEESDINLFGTSALAYGDNLRVNLGAQWMGNKEASRYVSRIGFSAGFHYEEGKLRLQLSGGNETGINEWGVGAGVMFPMRKGRSALRLSLDYSSMGSADVLRRNVFLIGLSVGSSDSWFVKRKYN